jgi:hypothetical protein
MLVIRLQRSREHMDVWRSRIGIGTALLAGILLGWLSAGARPTPMQASAGDRAGECIVATGPVLMEQDGSTKAPTALDALYFLDYKGGRLLATVPSYRMLGTKVQIIDDFVERDLVADFKLDPDIVPRPRFLMTTGSLGRYSAGWAPLYVFETTTGQVGVYRMQLSQSAGANAPNPFELVELRRYTKAAGGAPRP